MTLKFQQINHIKLDGSCFIDEFRATFDDLKQVFGELNNQPGDKSRVGWCLEFEDGTLAMIYDYKQTCPIEKIEYWCINGFDEKAGEHVRDAFSRVHGMYKYPIY